MATVVLTEQAQADFGSLPGAIRVRVQGVITRLYSWPVVSGAKPLRGNLAGSFRLRTGDYRVVFHVVGTTVIVDRIAIRRDVYDE